MPRLPRKRLLVAALLPLAAATVLVGTQLAASAAANPGPGFPAHFAAPYAEMWNSPSTLMAAANATGNKYYTLAFVISSGTCNATINGDTAITDAGWNNAVNSLRAAGGDVIMSFGGAGGSELTTCSTVAAMQAQYKRVIDQFNLTRIDLDIEGDTIRNTAANDRRNQALANLQQQYAAAGKTLSVDYTLATDPGGMGPDQISLLTNAKNHNLTVNAVNIMTMDYYAGAIDMGQAAISAANALHSQLGQIWTTKTSAQLWAMSGNTPMIGVNDDRSEVFTTQDASELESFAAANGIQLLSFWALGRDNAGSSGTAQSQYQFTNTFKAITGGGGTTPPPAGGKPIHGYGGKCVDVAGANSANGTAVQLYTCNGTGAQNWTRSGSTFTALGKCLDVAAAGTANGSLVQIYDCNGTAAQQWTTGASCPGRAGAQPGRAPYAARLRAPDPGRPGRRGPARRRDRRGLVGAHRAGLAALACGAGARHRAARRPPRRVRMGRGPHRPAPAGVVDRGRRHRDPASRPQPLPPRGAAARCSCRPHSRDCR